MNIEQAKKRLEDIVDFYKLNDENNYDYSDDVLISMRLVLDEIDRLNNIINKLEKWLNKISELTANIDEKMTCKNILDKLKELKEEGNK